MKMLQNVTNEQLERFACCLHSLVHHPLLPPLNNPAMCLQTLLTKLCAAWLLSVYVEYIKRWKLLKRMNSTTGTRLVILVWALSTCMEYCSCYSVAGTHMHKQMHPHTDIHWHTLTPTHLHTHCVLSYSMPCVYPTYVHTLNTYCRRSQWTMHVTLQRQCRYVGVMWQSHDHHHVLTRCTHVLLLCVYIAVFKGGLPHWWFLVLRVQWTSRHLLYVWSLWANCSILIKVWVAMEIGCVQLLLHV